ncbi:MAG: D-aminoacyl-tRNA deacylase [Chloroflexi bacterium]|nr:D-aminoacyl-tRNA deacylase [Chloroflexota bacterium]
MRAVVQRVRRASVRIGDSDGRRIESGLVVLAAVAETDEAADADYIADKVSNLRIMDLNGRMDRSVVDISGEVMLIPQFTLYANTRKGRRPSFSASARPEKAKPLLERLRSNLTSGGLGVVTGEFGAHMMVDLTNDGPVTIILDSADRHRSRRSA